MRFERFSPKQLAVLGWWCEGSPWRGRDAIICDGAVRSGKTLCLSLSFVLWSLHRFDGQSFGICGKTLTSLRRNLLTPLLSALGELGFACEYRSSQNTLSVSCAGKSARYYLFGGRDEGSAALIQGVTLAGVLFDEVALMPQSFVQQALARCSVEGSKFWFSCNPEHPQHWFYTDWIAKREEKNALYLHFVMRDNPSLSQTVLRRYESLYTGAFYDRYVLGKWTAVQGAVYPMFSERHIVDEVPACTQHLISCDYGTVNPASFGLWGESGGVWYRLREYYHDSRRDGGMKTDEEYADALAALAGDLPVEAVVVDPSAASFIQCLQRRGRFRVARADNDVLGGIRAVASALQAGRLRFHRGCKDTLREFSLYRWDLDAARDAPVKEHDHAMDDIRYFTTYALADSPGGFFAAAVRRA